MVFNLIPFKKKGLKFEFSNLLTNFQLLDIDGLSCGCDNVLVLFFKSNLFL